MTAGGKRQEILVQLIPREYRRLARRSFIAGIVPGAAAALFLRSRLGGDVSAGRANAQASDPTKAILPHLAADGFATPEPPAVPLRERIGQMVMGGFRGFSIDADSAIARDIVDRNISGTVLFDYDVPTETLVRNIQSPSQVAALTGQLQALTPDPILIAVDQEGGVVARLKPEHGFPDTMSAAQLGAIDDPEVTYDAGASIASTLQGVGINVNFAPVVDLNVNPDNPVIGGIDRSFSADPDVVVRNAEAFIRAHHDHGVLTALKHFPGHGSSTADSHLGFVDVTETWSEAELEPFARIITNGLADIVMTAHVFNANLDPDYPATLSYNTITGVLRGELGYEGVVCSDDMQMGAITENFGFEFAVEKAIQAGVDILLFGNNLVYDETTVTRVIDLIEDLVTAGTISEARIDLSYERIMALRARL